MDTRKSTSEMMSKLYEHEAVNKSNYLSSKNFNEKEQKLASCQDNDRGDVKVHSELPVKPIIYQHPESLAAGEYQTRVNPTSAYPCSQEPQTPCVKTSPCTNGALKFTQKMIEDQEILVSSLSQQGISEPLIRRHFERLLEEQSKQLHMLNENRLAEQKKSKIDLFKFKKQNQKRNNYETQEKSYSVNYNSAQAIDKPNCACASKITVNAAQSNQEQQQCVRNNEEGSKMIFDSQENNRPHKVEPSSLMKIRLQREVVNTQRRNNGLQNDTVALEIIQNCKNDKDKHVPVYHSNDSVYVRLNGTQDKLELENYQSMYAPETLKKQEKRTPYNGLENIRNSDNPQLAPKSLKCRSQQLLIEETGVSYPPQKSYPHYSTPVMNSSNDNRKHSEQYSNDADSQSQYENEAQLQPPNDVCHNECNSPQCTNQSNLTYWPEFQEPKIIGGLTYFARKPQSIPNQKNLNVENQKCSSSEKFYVS